VINVILKGMIIGIKFIMKINEVPIKLITPKKRNMKNNKQDINSIDEILLKDRYKVEHFFGNLKKVLNV